MKRRTQAVGHRWTCYLQVKAGDRALQKRCRWSSLIHCPVSIPRRGGQQPSSRAVGVLQQPVSAEASAPPFFFLHLRCEPSLLLPVAWPSCYCRLNQQLPWISLCLDRPEMASETHLLYVSLGSFIQDSEPFTKI